MIKKILLIFSILIFSFVNYITYATDEIISSQMDALNIPSFIKEGEKYTKEVFPDISLNDFLSSAIKGEIDNKGLLKQIILLFGDEIVDVIYLLGSIIVVIIIHSILKAFTENLENESVSQITYYIQYILIVTLIMTNFSNILIMIKESIQNLVGFMNNLIPILITLMLTTGNIVSANLMQPIILFIITFIGNFITTIIIPLVLIATALGIISKISDKIQIDKLSKFLKSSVVWILGVILTIFVGLISVEGSLSSSVDGITAKTTKAAVSSFIPVVGKILRRCSRYSNRL